MQTLSFTSGRHSACSGGQAKLVWDVLPARPKRTESLQQRTGKRQTCTPHAVDVEPVVSAASTMAGDGVPLTYLASTVSAGLLLLAGIGASLAQTTQCLATKKERESAAAAASPATGESLPFAFCGTCTYSCSDRPGIRSIRQPRRSR